MSEISRAGTRNQQPTSKHPPSNHHQPISIQLTNNQSASQPASPWLCNILSSNLPAFKKGLNSTKLSSVYPDHVHLGTTWTALHVAAFEGNIDCVKILLEAGADLEARDSTFNGSSLLWAAYALQFEMCRLLLELGADRDLVNAKNQSPVDLALLSLGPSATKQKDSWERLFKNVCPISFTLHIQTRRKDKNKRSLHLSDPATTTLTIGKRIRLSAKLGELDKESSPILGTPSTAGTPNDNSSMLASIGIVSNQQIIKQILNCKLHSHHSLQVNGDVKSLNVRILLNPGAEHVPQVILNHNYKPLQYSNNPEPHIFDYHALLNSGLNSFEVLVYEMDKTRSILSDPEMVVLFVNRV